MKMGKFLFFCLMAFCSNGNSKKKRERKKKWWKVEDNEWTVSVEDEKIIIKLV